jgi:hypothetical protein
VIQRRLKAIDGESSLPPVLGAFLRQISAAKPCVSGKSSPVGSGTGAVVCRTPLGCVRRFRLRAEACRGFGRGGARGSHAQFATEAGSPLFFVPTVVRTRDHAYVGGWKNSGDEREKATKRGCRVAFRKQGRVMMMPACGGDSRQIGVQT